MMCYHMPRHRVAFWPPSPLTAFKHPPYPHSPLVPTSRLLPPSFPPALPSNPLILPDCRLWPLSCALSLRSRCVFTLALLRAFIAVPFGPLFNTPSTTSPAPLPYPPPPQIYPGKGRTFVTRSGAKVTLSGSKTASMYRQRKKGAKLMWTQPWRRMHKKLSQDSAAKRKVRKVVKTVAARSMEGRDSATVRARKGGTGALPSLATTSEGWEPQREAFFRALSFSLSLTPHSPHTPSVLSPACSSPL